MLDFDFMRQILPDLLQAALITVEISTLAVLFGIVSGGVFGSLRVIGPRWAQTLIQIVVDYIRGVPPLVHIALIYFTLPRFGIFLNEFWTGVVALTIIATGYEVEIVRAAIESIDKGQREAARAIGMTEPLALRTILLPQAARRMIPALTNELANVVKASSLLSIIAVKEITQVGNALIFDYFVFTEIIIEMAVLYLLIVSVLQVASRFLEERVFAFGNVTQPTIQDIR